MKLHLDSDAFRVLIEQVSENTGYRQDVIEKDYYVSMLLQELAQFQREGLPAYFKGGTCLLYTSYENAKETERDILICDEFGYDESIDLPFGWYRVHQTKAGVPGTEFVKDFDVFISRDGAVYRYLLNNAQFESRVMVVKKDAETGNTVPLAGHGYELYLSLIHI